MEIITKGYDNDYLRQWKIVWLYFHKNYNLELLNYFLKNIPLHEIQFRISLSQNFHLK